MSAAAELLGQTATPVLVVSLLELEQLETRTPDQSQARRWIIEEIERRHPEVDAVLDAWADDVENDATYVETLLAAIPAEVLA